jgi:hypothetical protein
VTNRIPALIRLLGSPNDNEALGAARALVRELASAGAHLDDLARSWEETQASRPPPPPRSAPFDYSKVEAAVTLYAQDKAVVTTNKVMKAVHEMVRDCPRDDGNLTTTRYVFAQLRSLGFEPSRSLKSFSRCGAQGGERLPPSPISRSGEAAAARERNEREER